MAEDEKKKEDPKPPKPPKAPKAKPKKLSPRIEKMHADNIAKTAAIEKARSKHHVYFVAGNQAEQLLAEIIVGVRKGAKYDESTGQLTVPKA